MVILYRIECCERRKCNGCKKAVVIGLGIIGTGLGIAKIASGKAPAKFSTKWFETLSDADLNAE